MRCLQPTAQYVVKPYGTMYNLSIYNLDLAMTHSAV